MKWQPRQESEKLRPLGTGAATVTRVRAGKPSPSPLPSSRERGVKSDVGPESHAEQSWKATPSPHASAGYCLPDCMPRFPPLSSFQRARSRWLGGWRNREEETAVAEMSLLRAHHRWRVLGLSLRQASISCPLQRCLRRRSPARALGLQGCVSRELQQVEGQNFPPGGEPARSWGSTSHQTPGQKEHTERSHLQSPRPLH